MTNSTLVDVKKAKEISNLKLHKRSLELMLLLNDQLEPFLMPNILSPHKYRVKLLVQLKESE